MAAFLSRYLEQKLPTVLRQRLPELYFDNGIALPQVGDLQAGAQYITIETIQQYGQAAIMSGVAQDAPLSEVVIGRESFEIVNVIGAAVYSDPEIKAAEFAASNGQTVTNLPDERLSAMNRMINVRAHQLGAFGSTKHNMYGILNHPEVPLSNTGTFKPYAGNATADQIIDFITTETLAVWDGSNFVEMPNTLGVSPAMYKVITSRFRSSNTDITIYDAILRVNPSIQQIMPMRELASAQLEANGVLASGTNKDRIFLYNRDPQNVVRHFSPMVMMAPQQNGMLYNVCAYKGVSSVQFNYPKTARYVDYPIATTNN